IKDRGRFADVLQGERLDELRTGEQLLVSVGPPETGQVIDESVRKVPALAVGGHRRRAVTFREPRLAEAEDQGKMSKPGPRRAGRRGCGPVAARRGRGTYGRRRVCGWPRARPDGGPPAPRRYRSSGRPYWRRPACRRARGTTPCARSGRPPLRPSRAPAT